MLLLPLLAKKLVKGHQERIDKAMQIKYILFNHNLNLNGVSWLALSILGSKQRPRLNDLRVLNERINGYEST
jgi:hypothetical protein